MATDVIYNGVKLHNVTTRQWDQEVAYDESGTDMLATRYSLQFECIIHWSALDTDAPAWTGLGDAIPFDNPTNIHRELRWKLSQPRKQLIVTIGGEVALDIVPSGPTTATAANSDTHSGPKPRILSITHVAANKVFRILWSVECEVRECGTGTVTFVDPENYPSVVRWSNVLNNRWSIAETMDENAFVIRTIRGKLRLASANLLVGHSYKVLVIPTLEAGFKRERIHYEVQPNGLEANYEIVDKQVHTAAPWPASSMEVDYTERATGNGTIWHSSCVVRLSGPPNADKRLMIARAFQVIEARLDLNKIAPFTEPGVAEAATPAQDSSYFCEECTINEHIGQGNSVEALMSIRRQGGQPEHMKGLVTEKYGKPLELPSLLGGDVYNPLESLNPEYFGYNPHGKVRDFRDVLATLHCMLQQPCAPDEAHGIVETVAPTVTAEVVDPSRGETKQPTVDPAVISPGEWINQIEDDARENIYSVSRCESKYVFDPLRVQLPIMGGGTGLDDASLVLSLARRQCVREIRVEAERVGKWPKIPTPLDSYSDGSLTGKLLHHEVVPQPPSLDATGERQLFRLTATYKYAMNRPPTLQESVLTGVLPFTNHSIADTKFNPQVAYDPLLLAPGGAQVEA